MTVTVGQPIPPPSVPLSAANGMPSPEWYRVWQDTFRNGYTQRVATDNLVSQVDTLSTTVGGSTAELEIVKQSVQGIEARYSVTVDVNGYVTGIELLGSGSAGSFIATVDTFLIADPTSIDGDPVYPFAIGIVDGQAKVALKGDMIVTGSITADKLDVTELSAIVADLGTVTAGLIRDSADTIRFDLPNMRLYRVDGKMDIDLKNRTILLLGD